MNWSTCIDHSSVKVSVNVSHSWSCELESRLGHEGHPEKNNYSCKSVHCGDHCLWEQPKEKEQQKIVHIHTFSILNCRLAHWGQLVRWVESELRWRWVMKQCAWPWIQFSSCAHRNKLWLKKNIQLSSFFTSNTQNSFRLQLKIYLFLWHIKSLVV